MRKRKWIVLLCITAFLLAGCELVENIEDILFRDDDPVSVAKSFLEKNYSSNSLLSRSELLSKDASTFSQALQWRQKIFALRREKMGNVKKLISFEIIDSEIAQSDELAFVFIKSREEFVYLDEPKLPAMIGYRYFVVLAKEDANWKVLWATHHASSDVASETGKWVSTFHIPFLAYGEETVFQLDPVDYPVQELKQLLNGLEYQDFSVVYENERINIEAELEEEKQGLPATTDGLEPFDRSEMLRYAEEFSLVRNGEWPDYTLYGGNCQNFVSQILVAGGASMNDAGEYPWYYHSKGERGRAWSSVNSMRSLLDSQAEQVLSAIELESRYDLENGDLVYVDWDRDGETDHVLLVTHSGDKPRVAGNTEDAYNKRLTDYPGEKFYYHLEGHRP